MIVFAMNRLNYEEEIVYAFFEKMDDSTWNKKILRNKAFFNEISF